MPPTDDTLILVLGDYHLNKVKQTIDASSNTKLSNYGNMLWKCSNWMTIKSAKKEYFKYKKSFGPPAVVLLSVGNHDLTKVSTPNCIISSLLRTVTAFYKSGTNVVVLCSLVERLIVGDYNLQVNKINAVLSSRAAKLEWLHFFVILNSKLYASNEIFSSNGKDLLCKPQENIITNIKSLFEDSDVRGKMRNENHPKSFQASRSSAVGASSSNKTSIFKSELNLLQMKLLVMMKEKEKSNERSSKLDSNIDALNEYIEQLQTLDS